MCFRIPMFYVYMLWTFYVRFTYPYIWLCYIMNKKIQQFYNQNKSCLVSYHHHHHHVVLIARISLTLSCHSSLSFIALGRSSGQHPVSSHSCWMYVRAGRPAFARPCVGVHKSTSLMSSSLLLQQCPAYCISTLVGLFLCLIAYQPLWII